ncbi:DUF4384 domain-containing protein [Neosynechococcus sphagnicola]|uniref:DUF4384 domain-containing protein n=1 Tax=Neosynechococcus sphagnicola TaxID=1501145 RepID=UPI000691112C|nr:DUF4384 domain-containing protein [Neosynechococcus sphagnicola]
MAARRLVPQLQTLLAAKLLRLLTNGSSSRLGVKVTLEMVAPQSRILVEQATLRSPWPLPDQAANAPLPKANLGKVSAPNTSMSELLTLPVGSHVQYRVQNYGDRPIYLLLFDINSLTGSIALYSVARGNGLDLPEGQIRFNQPVVAPGTTLIFPQPSPDLAWVIRGPTGLRELQLICSHTPLTHTLTAALLSQGEIQMHGTPLLHPLEIAQATCQDLHQASLPLLPILEVASNAKSNPSGTEEPYSLDVNAWASFNFVYQVV